jgi:phage terminase Nu1 subunit (DNA packaging protein)
MSASREVLGLYREFLRVGRKFTNYNVREFVKRRAKEGFHEGKELTDAAAIAAALKQAKEQLAVAQRQSVVYSLFAQPVKSIMELKAAVGDQSITVAKA